jgi:1-deoxy-D-xylulose-5-phosphate synthase
MATQGMVVYCTIYSTFLQRAYDQVIHDVALQNLPVIFCVDRAGLVGEDGATHQGIFDIAYLRIIPNMMVYSPLNEVDLRNILFTVQVKLESPIAIRYPRGNGVVIDWQKPFKLIEYGKAHLLKKGTRVAILSNGFIGNHVISALEQVENPELFAHYDFAFVKPLDEKCLLDIINTYKSIITIEEGVITGGFGSAVAEYNLTQQNPLAIKIIGIPDEFINQGTLEQQQQYSGIDIKSLVKIFNTY